MKCRRYQKPTQYLHVSNRANETVQNSADYDKLYKIHPVFNMVQDRFAECYKPGQNQTIDECMIAFKGRLSYVQYCLPNQSRGELRCGCAMMLIQHISIDLRCILVESKTLLSFAFNMMW